jgi:ribosome biogenesis GTPase A
MSMKKFWQIVRDVIKESDVVLNVIDARMPEMTRNRKLETMIKKYRKPFIFVANKSDLVNKYMIKLHKNELEEIAPCIFVSTRERKGITPLRKKIYEIAKKRSRDSEISVGVIGYPNTGKSSVINALAGKSKAGTSSKSGWTRGVQWINAGGGMRLLDTPGVIPIYEDDEVRQGLIAVVNPSKLKYPEDVAAKIIEIFLEKNRKALENFYNIKAGNKDPFEIIKSIAQSRNMLKKGGVIDFERAYVTIIHDWQKGKLLLKK